MRLIYYVSLFLLPFLCFAQSTVDTIPVIENGHRLENAWMGGLNYCQLNDVDMNGDGKLDLLVFDKTASKLSTYINLGIADSASYVYKPEYISKFPSGLQSWIILADYNCDGKNDLFTSEGGYIDVYRNDFNSTNGLQFTKVVTSLLSDTSGGVMSPIYISAVSLPSINDIDNDGDLDILGFDINGNFVNFHKNLSMETYGNCSILKFQLFDKCWGNFIGSNVINSITLNVSCKSGRLIEKSNEERHAGYSMITFDKDNDGDKEMLLSNINANDLILLTNGGDINNADITSFNIWPDSRNPLTVIAFPNVFYLDVDNDNVKDLIVCAGGQDVSSNRQSILFYKNTGTNTAPVFVYKRDNLLQETMIDVGSGLVPVWFDVDADGKKDLMTAPDYELTRNGDFKFGISVYKNTGTLQYPKLELLNRDFFRLDSFAAEALSPSFGDLDGDGDKDMVCGDISGHIMYFENTALSGQAPYFSYVTANYFNIDIGFYSIPQLYDLNKDGLLDLIIGERNGNLNYYQNAGTITNPDFSRVTNGVLGGVDVRMPNTVIGHSAPCFFNDNGVTKLLVGSESGNIYFYTDIDNNLNGLFHLADATFNDISEGGRTVVALEDINNDGINELTVGNFAGGCKIYTQLDFSGIKKQVELAPAFEIIPNPASESVKIVFKKINSNEKYDLQVFDIVGNMIIQKTGKIENENNIMLNSSTLPSGSYIVRCATSKGFETKKLIIAK